MLSVLTGVPAEDIESTLYYSRLPTSSKPHLLSILLLYLSATLVLVTPGSVQCQAECPFGRSASQRLLQAGDGVTGGGQRLGRKILVY